MCHRQLGELGKHQRELRQLGALVCAISYEDGPALDRMKMDHALGASFLFLSDPVGELADDYNGMTKRGIHRPAIFVFDRNFNKVYSFNHKDHHVRPPVEDVLDALRKTVDNEHNR